MFDDITHRNTHKMKTLHASTAACRSQSNCQKFTTEHLTGDTKLKLQCVSYKDGALLNTLATTNNKR